MYMTLQYLPHNWPTFRFLWMYCYMHDMYELPIPLITSFLPKPYVAKYLPTSEIWKPLSPSKLKPKPIEACNKHFITSLEIGLGFVQQQLGIGTPAAAEFCFCSKKRVVWLGRLAGMRSVWRLLCCVFCNYSTPSSLPCWLPATAPPRRLWVLMLCFFELERNDVLPLLPHCRFGAPRLEKLDERMCCVDSPLWKQESPTAQRRHPLRIHFSCTFRQF